MRLCVGCVGDCEEAGGKTRARARARVAWLYVVCVLFSDDRRRSALVERRKAEEFIMSGAVPPASRGPIMIIIDVVFESTASGRCGVGVLWRVRCKCVRAVGMCVPFWVAGSSSEPRKDRVQFPSKVLPPAAADVM